VVVYSNSAHYSVLASAERDCLEGWHPWPNASVSERVVFATASEQMNLLDASKLFGNDLARE
jgi:hypothetical protein